MTICEKCNGRGTVQLSFDNPRLTCSACHGRRALLPVRPVDGMWENDSVPGTSRPRRLGAAMDEIFYKHHEGGNE